MLAFQDGNMKLGTCNTLQYSLLQCNVVKLWCMLACGWHAPGFLKLFVCRRLYVCVCFCMCLCSPLWLLKTSGMMWHDMDTIWLVKQGLQLLYGNCSQYC